MKNLKINKIITKKYGTIGNFLKSMGLSRGSMDSFQRGDSEHHSTINKIMVAGGEEEAVKEHNNAWKRLIKK